MKTIGFSTILVTIFAVVLLVSGAEAQSGDRYGALAIYFIDEPAYGWAANHPSDAAAVNAAMSICGEGCTVVMRFRNSCAAYVADRSGNITVHGWAVGRTRVQAERDAMNQCRMKGGRQASCIVRNWVCTSR